MSHRPYSDHYRKYKEASAKAAPKRIPPERARQNALSAPGGLVAQPKDFDWIEKNIPCQAACPARTDIPGYLEAIAQGDFEKAYRLNLADNVFPAVLGRVCTRPCEPACRHGWPGLGEPVVERVHCGAMLRRDSEMQRVSSTQPQGVLVGKPRRRPELPARHGQHGEALGDQFVEHGQRRRALLQADLTGPQLDCHGR